MFPLNQKLKTALAISFACSLSSGIAYAGHETSGGGHGVVCTDPVTQTKTAYVLDFYEAVAHTTLHLDLGPPNLSLDDKIELVLKRVEAVDPLRASRYRSELKFMRANRIFLSLVSPADVADATMAWIKLKPGCAPVQAAIRIENPKPFEKKFAFDQDTWNLMDNDQKAGLELHEAAYYDQFLNYPETVNSDEVRPLNAFFSSKESEGISLQAYIGIQTAFLGHDTSFTVDGIAFSLYSKLTTGVVAVTAPIVDGSLSIPTLLGDLSLSPRIRIKYDLEGNAKYVSDDSGYNEADPLLVKVIKGKESSYQSFEEAFNRGGTVTLDEVYPNCIDSDGKLADSGRSGSDRMDTNGGRFLNFNSDQERFFCRVEKDIVIKKGTQAGLFHRGTHDQVEHRVGVIRMTKEDLRTLSPDVLVESVDFASVHETVEQLSDRLVITRHGPKNEIVTFEDRKLGSIVIEKRTSTDPKNGDLKVDYRIDWPNELYTNAEYMPLQGWSITPSESNGPFGFINHSPLF